MALKFNTDSLKRLSNIAIECKGAQEIGFIVFNNLGISSPEYIELCLELDNACKKIIEETEKLKAAIPTI